jgi:hypothetical protein
MCPVRFRFDHAVVIVESLPEAVRDFAGAGFTVSPGGRHDVLPTENALVAFADGAYIELLAPIDPDTRGELRALRATPRWESHLHGASAIARRFLPRLAGDAGVGDVCLAGHRLARFAAECRQRDTIVTGPVPMRRERADGEALAWDLLLPADDFVPFLIEDRTPRDWRVPDAMDAIAHQNGAMGISDVFVHATEPVPAALRLADLFEAQLEARSDGRTLAGFAGVNWWLEPGETSGARAIGIAGVQTLPDALLALGVRPAPEDGA